MSYAECLKKYYNAVDGPFYDAISLDLPRVRLTAMLAIRL